MSKCYKFERDFWKWLERNSQKTIIDVAFTRKDLNEHNRNRERIYKEILGELKMEWISVKEELPAIGQLIDLWKQYCGTISRVRLVKTPDEDFRDGFFYEWKHPSGIHAASFEASDEWRVLVEEKKAVER